MPEIFLDSVTSGPFSMDDDEAYARWREEKLSRFPGVDELFVDMADPANPTIEEAKKVRALMKRAGMAIFRAKPAENGDEAREIIQSMAGGFCLKSPDMNPYADDDALTPLHVAAGEEGKEKGRRLYIPYTDRAINWHTDGYYNPAERTIKSMILYCLHPAASGGENCLYDPEIVYIMMRDADPAMVRAFSHPEAFTIPANDVDDDVTRGDSSAPVFSVDALDGSLVMRYSARKKNIIWRDDDDTRRAVEFIENLLSGDGAEKSPYMFTYLLQAGEGLICNNVLHTRTSFSDSADEGARRYILRGRYRQRMAQVIS